MPSSLVLTRSTRRGGGGRPTVARGTDRPAPTTGVLFDGAGQGFHATGRHRADLRDVPPRTRHPAHPVAEPGINVGLGALVEPSSAFGKPVEEWMATVVCCSARRNAIAVGQELTHLVTGLDTGSQPVSAAQSSAAQPAAMSDPFTIPTRFDGAHDRVAVVVPGVGYSPARPLLHFARGVLLQHGWTVQELWWRVPDDSRSSPWTTGSRGWSGRSPRPSTPRQGPVTFSSANPWAHSPAASQPIGTSRQPGSLLS